jgi:uncharacterized RDD family membrane protein YckC
LIHRFFLFPCFYDENKITMRTSVYFSLYLWSLSYENVYNTVALTTEFGQTYSKFRSGLVYTALIKVSYTVKRHEK